MAPSGRRVEVAANQKHSLVSQGVDVGVKVITTNQERSFCSEAKRPTVWAWNHFSIQENFLGDPSVDRDAYEVLGPTINVHVY